MDIKDALEQAYKNGYNDGLRDLVRRLENEAYTLSPIMVDMADVHKFEKQLTKR